jgi:endonuclease/exonuclease/phosphatase family metal-dependent hydrolase
LKEKNYKIVHFETSDKRGIDNALVYNADFVKVLSSNNLRLKSVMGDEIFSRDIVYTKAKLGSDTIHFFVNHWPSRRGGKEASEPKREAFAKLLKNSSDSILNKNKNANIIIMGDFNDEPSDISIYNVLQAKPLDENILSEDLYNLAFKKHSDSIGTYHYWKDNVWNMLDQFIVSGNLLSSESALNVEDKEMHINDNIEFLHKNEDGTMVPSKSYGKFYYGGYSDHLSIYIYLKRN